MTECLLCGSQKEPIEVTKRGENQEPMYGVECVECGHFTKAFNPEELLE